MNSEKFLPLFQLERRLFLMPSSAPAGQSFSGSLKVTEYVEQLVSYGLMVIAFGLFFVSLNHYTEYAFFTLLSVWVLTSWKNGTLHWTKTSMNLPIGGFLAWVLITIPWSTDPLYSFHEWRKTIAQMLMFYFVINAVKNDHQIEKVIMGVVAGVAGLSLLESWHYWRMGWSLWDMAVRGGDLSGSSQWLSVYVVMGLPVLLFGFQKPKSWITRCVFWFGLGATILGLFVSHTRGAWVAVGAQAVVYCCLRFFRQGWVALMGGILVVSIVFVMLLAQGPHQHLFYASAFTNPSSMQIRFNTWTLAAHDIQESPLVGVGYGKHSFGGAHPDLPANVHRHIHNTFLSKAVQVGVPGFIFFVSMFGVLLMRAHGLYRHCVGDGRGEIALAILLMVVGIIVRNVFDDMFIGTVAYLFWLLVGLLFSLNNRVMDSRVPQSALYRHNRP